jgi:hypothetical protein
MQTIETSDHIEAQRCRRAQYTGLPATLTLNGSTVLGVVMAVRPEPGPRWVVTIVPKEAKTFSLPRQRPSFF